MTESQLYKELGQLTKNKSAWEQTDGNSIVRIHCQGAIKAVAAAQARLSGM